MARKPSSKIKNPPGIAILGAGPFGRDFHYTTLDILRRKGEVRILGVYDRDLQKAEAAARDFKIPKVYRNFSEVLGESSASGYAVLVPPKVSREVILSLLPAGKPIFSEKPPGYTAEESRELSDKVLVPNVVAFNRRYMPQSLVFQKEFSKIKNVYFAEAHFYRSARTESDFVRCTGIHGINLLEHFFGSLVLESVETWDSPDGVSKIRIARFRFGNAARLLLKIFPACGSTYERIEVHSPETSLYFYGPNTTDAPGRIEVHEKGKVRVAHQGSAKQHRLETWGLVGEWRDFLQAIRTGKTAVSNFQNAWTSMDHAEKIETGRLG